MESPARPRFFIQLAQWLGPFRPELAAAAPTGWAYQAPRGAEVVGP